jgi:RNA polymerase sigma factor (TIGR02999 family)
MDGPSCNGAPIKDRPDELFVHAYDELRAIAAKLLRGERPGHTLQATALVHEAYLRLHPSIQGDEMPPAMFFHQILRAMECILVDHARAHNTIKRGGRLTRVPLSLTNLGEVRAGEKSCEFVSFVEALLRLEEEDPRAAEVVRLRFYAGLLNDQIAAWLGVCKRSVERDWQSARARLAYALRTECEAGANT